MRFQWWQTVLLEWDSNSANSCSVIEKSERSEISFLQLSSFLVTLLPVARKKTIFNIVFSEPIINNYKT